MELRIGVKEIKKDIFFNCALLGRFRIPKSIMLIGLGRGPSCMQLEEMDLTHGIIFMSMNIDTREFYNCKSVWQVTFVSTCKTIVPEPEMFALCKGLAILELWEGLREI